VRTKGEIEQLPEAVAVAGWPSADKHMNLRCYKYTPFTTNDQ
jgi:hypothetical protein